VRSQPSRWLALAAAASRYASPLTPCRIVRPFSRDGPSAILWTSCLGLMMAYVRTLLVDFLILTPTLFSQLFPTFFKGHLHTSHGGDVDPGQGTSCAAIA
jgi:hypothetical protein